MPTLTRRPTLSHWLAIFTLTPFALIAFTGEPPSASAQTTSFTYQGQLTAGGSGADGTYDTLFGLFDSATNGTQIGTTQNVPDVSVSNGLFTVQLDFGVNAFPGANRFLEISVRPVGGGSFTLLTPRQQISSAPYAIRTLSAASADALSSACAGCVQDAQIQSVAGSKVNGTIPLASLPAASGNYIQNTSTPQPNSTFNISGNGIVGGNLTVAGTLNGPVNGNFIQNRSTQQTNATFNVSGNGTVGGTLSAKQLLVRDTTNFLQGTFDAGSGTAGIALKGARQWELQSVAPTDGVTPSSFLLYDRTASAYRMVVDSSGNVGIGTTAPATRLHAHDATNFLQGTFDGGSGTAGIALKGTRQWELQAVEPGNAVTPNSFVLYDRTGSAYRIVVGATGNLGIGVTAPTFQLQLSSDSAAKPNGGSWTNPSDVRLKQDIEPFTDGLATLKQINPVRYTLNGKAGLPKGSRGIGVIAQDLRDLLPYTLSTFKAKLSPDDDEETELYAFESSALAFVTINAIKELSAKVDRWEQRAGGDGRMRALQSENALLREQVHAVQQVNGELAARLGALEQRVVARQCSGDGL